MLKTKLLIIVFTLILIGFGLVIWANTTELSLSQKIKARQINNFSQCLAAGYPVQESYPRRCVLPDGKGFIENINNTQSSDSSQIAPPANNFGQSICENKCGDNFCQVVVCQATGCPCSESKTSCPRDCEFN